MRLTLYELPGSAEPGGGLRVVYDLEQNAAYPGAAVVHGPALLWELAEEARPDAALSAPVDLDPAADWLMRCDRVDFPPGGVAYRHTHPGPGIRRLLFGELTIETGGRTRTLGPGEPWFESGPEPVLATGSAVADTAFVRVMLLPREWAGRRTIRYADPADGDKPRLQRATVLLEESIELS
jgi:hypothetical protein